MKHLWMLLGLSLGLLPYQAWPEAEQVQWLDLSLEPVEAGSENAAYYYAPPVADGEHWAVTIYYAGEGDRPKIEARLNGPDFLSARMIGDYTRYHRDGGIDMQGTLNDRGQMQGAFTDRQVNGRYTITEYESGVRHGSRRQFHANGELESEKHFINGKVQDGECLHYDESGAVSARHYYLDGKLHDVSERLHNGVVVLREHYQHGKRHGLREQFSGEGQKLSETAYADGRQHGVAKRWEQGEPSSETHYRQGKRHGIARAWRNGVLTEESNYVDGRRRGESRQFHKNGSLRRYEHRDTEGKLTERREYGEDGEPTSLFILEDSDYGPAERRETYSGGALTRRQIQSRDRRWRLHEQFDEGGEEPTYRRETVDNKMHGRQVNSSHWEKAVEISEYRHGTPVGEHRKIDADGELLSGGSYRNGKKVGDWITRGYESTVYESYDNQGRLQGERREVDAEGELLLREHYVDGELQGKQMKWRRGGRLISEGHYLRGNRVGDWRLYDDQYDATFEGKYLAGEKIGLWPAYSDDGYERVRMRFVRGEPVDKRYVFARNGALEEMTRYKNGRIHGKREGYRDGALARIERYRDGERHGLSEYFLESGERYMTERYENGSYLGPQEDGEHGEELQ